jgi:hypothetical protein
MARMCNSLALMGHPLSSAKVMSEPTNRAPTPPSVTARRRRFTGAHPYPALPQSRLPLLRGVLWLTWAAFLAVIDGMLELLPGGRRSARGRVEEAQPETRVAARAPRLPSLTPTG